MAKSPRGKALDNLVALLETIRPPTYKTHVRTVARHVLDWQGAPLDGALPYIGIKPEQTSIAYQPGRMQRNVTTASLGCHLKATANDATAYDRMDDLIDDLIAAVDSDMTLGGCAVSCKVTRFVTDEGDPTRMDSHGGIVSAVVTLEIVTQRDTGSQ